MHIYCDGAWDDVNIIGMFGCSIYSNLTDSTPKDTFTMKGQGGNNSMELKAIHLALSKCEELEHTEIFIYTDQKFLTDAAILDPSKKQKKKITDVINKLDKLSQLGKTVKLKYVKSKGGDRRRSPEERKDNFLHHSRHDKLDNALKKSLRKLREKTKKT